MNTRQFILAGILALTAVVSQPKIVFSYNAEDLSRIAKEVTVIIDGQDLASGVIISHRGDDYTVLTNWHAFKSPENDTITTRDGVKHQIKVASIRRIGKLDLAIFTFTSNKFYRVAELGNSDTISEGSPLYVTGAPANLQGINSRSLLVVSGQLVGFDTPAQNGYTLVYSNNTMPGMSGGSVIDKNGNLVGIHGVGSRDTNGQKAGFNLGIPINLFVTNADQMGIKYTATYQQLDRQTPTLTQPTFLRGRPTEVNGSENTNGACAGEKC